MASHLVVYYYCVCDVFFLFSTFAIFASFCVHVIMPKFEIAQMVDKSNRQLLFYIILKVTGLFRLLFYISGNSDIYRLTPTRFKPTWIAVFISNMNPITLTMAYLVDYGGFV